MYKKNIRLCFYQQYILGCNWGINFIVPYCNCLFGWPGIRFNFIGKCTTGFWNRNNCILPLITVKRMLLKFLIVQTVFSFAFLRICAKIISTNRCRFNLWTPDFYTALPHCPILPALTFWEGTSDTTSTGGNNIWKIFLSTFTLWSLLQLSTEAI